MRVSFGECLVSGEEAKYIKIFSCLTVVMRLARNLPTLGGIVLNAPKWCWVNWGYGFSYFLGLLVLVTHNIVNN